MTDLLADFDLSRAFIGPIDITVSKTVINGGQAAR